MSLLFVLQYDYALWLLKILAFDHDFNWYNLSCECKQKKIIPQKNSDIIMKRRDSGITRRQRLITAQHSHIRVHSWLKYAPVGVQVAAIACRAGGIGGGTVCWSGVLRGHFLGIKMQHWNKWLSSLLSDFDSFWSTLLALTQSDAWKKAKNTRSW